MTENDKILVGKIVGAQGLCGEVRVQTYTQNPEDFRDLKIENLNIKFVRLAAPNSTVIIAKIDGIDDRNAADELRGTPLFIDRAALPAPDAGEYYIADLIGMKAGELTVIDVHNFGAGDILELSDGTMASFTGAKVDLEKREIILNAL